MEIMIFFNTPQDYPSPTTSPSASAPKQQHYLSMVITMVNCVRLVIIIAGTSQAAFLAPPGPTVARAGTKLNFGFNGLGSPPDDGKADAEKPEKKITARGLIQLITAGMGAPFLGDYQGVDSVSANILFWCFVSNDIHMRVLCANDCAMFFRDFSFGWFSAGWKNDVYAGGKQSRR
jgi:hypothetical protein